MAPQWAASLPQGTALETLRSTAATATARRRITHPLSPMTPLTLRPSFPAPGSPPPAFIRRQHFLSTLALTKHSSPLQRRIGGLHLTCRSSASAPSTVAVLVGEDFHKAGGTEIEFVQMQAEKEAHGQDHISSLLDKLLVGEGGAGVDLLDVAVVGCGPAGLSLAAELGSQGLRVGLIGSNSPFVNTYGVWLDEFQKLGLSGCIDQAWEDTILYTESNTPINTGRAYARVDKTLLRNELLSRCKRAGVHHLDDDVASIDDVDSGGSTVVTKSGDRVRARLVVVAAGATSGKFLQYTKATEGVGAQTAYGIEVEMESAYPYDPKAMVFMDYRDIPGSPAPSSSSARDQAFAALPSFLYAMPTTPQRVFFEETCLAARPAMPFSVLKERLHRRLQGLGVKYSTVFEEEWSYIPVGGDLPVTTQQALGFGAAASLIHPATGYSLTRSLSEAPGYAAAIAAALRDGSPSPSATEAARQAWRVLWSPERKRQRAFMVFGLELILQLDVATTREFFSTFFKLPPWLWRGFLATSLSSVDLLYFALYTFAVAPNELRFRLVKHLVTHPSGSRLIQAYLGKHD